MAPTRKTTFILGKLFVFIKERTVMGITETTEYLVGYANEVCFTAAVIISLLFFRQYKKYEQEAEKEEMIEKFLKG